MSGESLFMKGDAKEWKLWVESELGTLADKDVLWNHSIAVF